MAFGRLEISHPDGKLATVELTKRQMTIGRASDVDVPINDGQVSRRHATLLCGPEGVRLVDGGSANGTFLGTSRVPAQQPVLRRFWYSGSYMEEGTTAAFKDLTGLIERGFAGVADDIADLRSELKGDIADLRTELKGDIAELRTELKADIAGVDLRLSNIETELRDISKHLDAVEENYGNLRGVTKEIDELRDRVRRMEATIAAGK